jgi:heme exporter protein D
MDLGPHAAFIWASYGATALVIAGLVARAVLDERQQKQALIKLEAQGVRRRSARGPSDLSRP